MRIRRRLPSLMLCCCLGFAVAGHAGSWAQINQPLERPSGWRQLLADSTFALGETKAYEADASLKLRDYGSYPSIDGSTVCVPMGMELARQHLGMSEADLAGFVTFSTTHSAYERLILGKGNPNASILSERAAMDPEHPVDLILATGPSDEESALAEEHRVTLVKEPFCLDAFVFIVNKSNPVDSLTVDQIRAIYTNMLANWDEVGGEQGKEIAAYQRPKNSGSQTAMEQMVMQGIPISGAFSNFVSDGMADLVAQVGNYDNGRYALGYSYLYYVDVLYKSGDIKVLAIDGVLPTPENLRSGAYPFTTSYYAVHLAGNQTAAAFADWLLSKEGQACVAQAGYVPVSGD